MAQSWRLKTVEIDNTEKTATPTEVIGVIGILSPKGPKKFTKFNKGDTRGILNTFGYPSKDYPMIQDALDLVNKCSIYVASPYKNGSTSSVPPEPSEPYYKYGGVFVTPTGTIPFNEGTRTKPITIGDATEYKKTIGIGNGTDTVYTTTIKTYNHYIPESIKLYENGTLINDFQFDGNQSTSTEEHYTSTSVNNCVFNKQTGRFDITFSSSVTNGTVISISYDFDLKDTYFVLFDKNPQEDDLQVEVKSSPDVDGAFEISVTRYDPVSLENVEVNGSPFLVGLSETSKNTYGENIYIENVFGDNQNLFDAQVINSTVGLFADDKELVPLVGGSRGETCTAKDIAPLYDELQDTNKFQIKFVVDCSADEAVITKFVELRNNYQKRCRFLYPTANVSGQTIIESPNTYNFGVTNNRGLYQYCLSWGIHVDTYQGNNFLCSNMGLIAGRLVDALNNGTGCPAWIDENGVGGLLGSSITKLAQEGTSESVLEALDNLNFNAVVNDYNYGPMIVGWRTRQVKKTVYSNIPQSSLADTIIELVEKNVLPNRIGKLIDEATYATVSSGINGILDTYSQFFEDYYVWCDSENNTPEMREREELVVTVGVIFKNYARTILFTWTAYKAGTDLQMTMTA